MVVKVFSYFIRKLKKYSLIRRNVKMSYRVGQHIFASRMFMFLRLNNILKYYYSSFCGINTDDL